LELAQHLREAVAAVELGAGLEVLPAEEEAHEIRGGHGFDRATETPERQAVNSGEQPAVAPFLVRRPRGEMAAEGGTRPLERGEPDLDPARRQAEARGEPRGARRPGARGPAAAGGAALRLFHPHVS